MIEPRPYQSEALKKILKSWENGITRQLVSLPTGCGKTIIFGLVAEALRKRTLILAHREELLYQAEQKIRLVYPDADTGILKAEQRDGLNSEICIASVQTAVRRIEELASKGYELLICDEAHHATSPSYLRIFEDLGFMADDKSKLLLGVTATAQRADGVGLNNVFEKIVFERSILAMMKAGFLCDIRGIQVQTGEDISTVNMQAGDFAVNRLAALIDIPERNNLVADTYLKYGENRRGVVFGVKVEHALHLAQAFRERGIACEAVYGDMSTEERQDVLRRYADHELQLLTNVGVLTEGWDVPDTSIIMMARPTKSRGLYIQCVGRGLRIAPNKQDCLLVDFVDVSRKHELCDWGTLIGKKIKKSKEPRTLLQEAQESETEYQRGVCLPPKVNKIELFERSKFVWQAVREHYKISLVDNTSLWCQKVEGGYLPVFISPMGEKTQLSEDVLPLDYAMGVAEDYARKLDTAKYSSKDASWRRYPATDKQLNMLRMRNIAYSEGITKGEASDILGGIMAEERATSKQVWFIKQNHLHNSPELLTKQEAIKIISEYKRSQELATA